MTAAGSLREAVIDVDVIRKNVATLRARVAPARFLAVVKANGYGHGAVAVARAVLDGGADQLGVVDIAEALELRGAGIRAPILTWLHDPDEDFREALTAGIDIGVSSRQQLDAVASAVAAIGSAAVVHLKVDTGLSRNGLARDGWDAALGRAAELERAGMIRVEGIFTHLANEGDDDAQLAIFEAAVVAARAVGLRPSVRHAAATAASLRLPAAHYEMVRCGIGCYGLSPFADGASLSEWGLTPAMTLRTKVAAIRRVEMGTGVSYGYAWRASRETTLALIPLGYADGIPRNASSGGEVSIRGHRFPVVGAIAMDQFVVNVGDAPIDVGDQVVVFGSGASGEPTVADWARGAKTIGHEIVTRIGGRVSRSYRGEA